MNIKNIAKGTVKYISSASAYAVTSTIIEKTMPEPENKIEEIKFTAGQVSLSMGAGYLASQAVEKEFDDMWTAASDLKSSIKDLKKNKKKDN